MSNFFPKAPDKRVTLSPPIVEGPPKFQDPPITSWSFSRILDFEACPYRVLLKSVIKAEGPELPPHHPLVKGRKQHEAAEYFIKGEIPMAKEIKKMDLLLDLCKQEYSRGYATVEEDWGFDSSWGTTGWWDDDIWLRVKCDATITFDDAMTIIDWKSGKSIGYEVKQMQQAQLYVAAAFMKYPDIDLIEVKFGFFKDGKVWAPRQQFKRDRAAKYIQRWTQRAGELTSCTDFIPKPSKMNCNYCSFGPQPNGSGACAYAVDQ